MTGLPAEMMLVGNDIALNEDGTVATDDVVESQADDAEMEEEEPTMNEAGLQRSWPSASIETGADPPLLSRSTSSLSPFSFLRQSGLIASAEEFFLPIYQGLTDVQYVSSALGGSLVRLSF
jgi:hypothetical protein